MPRQNGRLTEREQAFAIGLAKFGDPHLAAAAAGYSARSVPVMASRLVNDPAIRAEANRRIEHALLAPGGGADVALATLLEVAGNRSAPPSARVQASKVLLDQARGVADGGSGADLQDMSRQAIRAMLTDLYAQQAAVIELEANPPEPSIFD